MEATKLAVEKVNHLSLVPGVNLGEPPSQFTEPFPSLIHHPLNSSPHTPLSVSTRVSPTRCTGLRVADTCSLEGLSVKVAMQAWMVDAFACPEPVLTLGYLGELQLVTGAIN
ncbi:hypothetical protein E2C01_013256 [Portunus trituberculatus]|uniref:Uncharacterized protein n=1 Tax=Portunus trituberculatus TaxID=210409 RepID=A0A5B7DG54_PORTR|nr:hypothetical protein [Portunus trituberculatus]